MSSAGSHLATPDARSGCKLHYNTGRTECRGVVPARLPLFRTRAGGSQFLALACRQLGFHRLCRRCNGRRRSELEPNPSFGRRSAFDKVQSACERQCAPRSEVVGDRRVPLCGLRRRRLRASAASATSATSAASTVRNGSYRINRRLLRCLLRGMGLRKLNGKVSCVCSVCCLRRRPDVGLEAVFLGCMISRGQGALARCFQVPRLYTATFAQPKLQLFIPQLSLSSSVGALASGSIFILKSICQGHRR